MKIEMIVLDEKIEFEIPDELYEHIKMFARRSGMTEEQAIAQALMQEMENEKSNEVIDV